LIAIILIALPIYYGNQGMNTFFIQTCNLAGFLLLFTVIVLFVWPEEKKKEQQKSKSESEYKYSLSVHFLDVQTGKTADIHMSGDDIEKICDGICNFVQASTLLVNMDDVELEAVAFNVKQHFENEKTKRS
jgi:hypothetical protein